MDADDRVDLDRDEFRDELGDGFLPLLAHPPAPPRPVEAIAARARQRAARRWRGVAVAVTVVVAGSAWGISRLDPSPEPTSTIGPADAGDPVDDPPATEPEATSTTTATTPPTTGSPESQVARTSSVEDTAIGTTAGTVEYTGGSWTRCGGCDIATDDASYYYGYEAGESYTVRFEGVRLEVVAPDDHHGGVAEVTVDGEPATTPTVDFFTTGDRSSTVVWDSGLLADGAHEVTFTIRAGEHEVVLFDRADVYTVVAGGDGGDGNGPADPPTPPTDPPAGAAPGLLGAGVYDPYELAGWLDRPVDIWETWQPTSWDAMVGIPTVHQYMTGEGPAPFDRRWTGRLSFGQPMWAEGENAARCNSGANDAGMRRVAQALVDAGFPDAYIRLGWEMDGSWFGSFNGAWVDPPGWVACWRRWHGIFKAASPAFQLVWNPNFESNTGAGPFDVRTVWPGDEFVDAAGPDIYDWGQDPDKVAANGAPIGIHRWVDFVVHEHGKPFAMPEWGVHEGDLPGFVDQHFDVLDELKANGQLAYASYFFLGPGCTHKLHVEGCNPQASATYRERAGRF